ncbi:hypothetical protein EJ08DRAFT_725165 [Tothia fuscella]|uniref:DUF6594 domain-containing protein n=1 Tax=Tothia fuscella TaxID=1048955 RepID=A0A9P4NI87_9PEZI|nr:hypothetical protein EJ08DRAFT_725165 [Tothia fuscella]
MRKRYVPSFPSLAAFIASDRDRTTLIFKRFDRLAARNLLHLQSELAQLQKQLDVLDEKDASHMEQKQCLRNWDDFMAVVEGVACQKERFELSERIRRTMRDYSMVLKTFRSRFGDSKTYPTLGGTSADLYDDRDDLVVLNVDESPDRLTAFAQNHMTSLFATGETDGQVAYASDVYIARFVVICSILLATFLLIGAIIGLYIVQSPKARLGMIAVFTTLFAFGVGLLTNARRPEIFGATAAYAAVLVVFVSGNLGSAGTECVSLCAN